MDSSVCSKYQPPFHPLSLSFFSMCVRARTDADACVSTKCIGWYMHGIRPQPRCEGHTEIHGMHYITMILEAAPGRFPS